ncbi:hypothetical protein EV13_1946 [Prochlorococcus sp. MIT 0702]|nr:hypothetical protein EV13_1946 [Prochlorococcus sp. MIT 0702]KGG28107.1 hypothetical protein EV12_0855 [Prochlorococcus sp. MIT 0701]KGG32814.1 hypothetical protein EV14_1956 [Prochlorococcus sp. MIT 0703]
MTGPSDLSNPSWWIQSGMVLFVLLMIKGLDDSQSKSDMGSSLHSS